MASIKLTPTGQLRWVDENPAESSGFSEDIKIVFERNWTEGLFALAANKVQTAGMPTLRYWQSIADRYLTALCHIPESTEDTEVVCPTEAELETWLLTAPPMVGGEYLSLEMLHSAWKALDAWAHKQIQSAGQIKRFLETHAPKWHQVGRVCFHLAENKTDTSYPFAFMATYSTGFGTGGKLKHLPLRAALEQYAGAKNRSALIKLLTPVQQAASSVSWVASSVESGHIYQPQAWTAEQAYAFLQSAMALEEAGIMVQLPNWWKKRPRPTVALTIGQKKLSQLGTDALLDFNVQFALGDQTLSEKELRSLMAGQEGLVWFKGQWIEVDRKKLQEAIDHWQGLNQHAKEGNISFIEGMRLLAGTSIDLKHQEQYQAERPWVHVEAGQALREILEALRDPTRLGVQIDCGNALQADLRTYQRHGIAWLNFLMHLGLGACLADDMGLGKTLQVLALLLAEKHKSKISTHRPSLLVIPASLLGNWRQEAVRFTPSLRLTFLHPAENDRQVIDQFAADPEKQLYQTDLAVTTYSMLSRQDWLKKVPWKWVILDEAQAIKNPSTIQSKACKALNAQGRIALTGTPVENRLGDLWSLFDFINPGLLGSASVFKEFIKTMESRQTDHFGPLRRLVSPYILRRLKTDRSIIADLPEKIETSCYCGLSKTQIILYEKAVKTLKSMLENAEGIARRGIILQSLMRFKQICNHPSQLTGDGSYAPHDSGKFLRLAEICEEITSRQEKALIFTQFREITDPLAEFLAGVFGRPGLVLHGGIEVKKRKELIRRFQAEDGPPFFILSLKAGGTGLNLTAASHIIHFDRWWNPAVENQATDRVFRIGQKRNVLVHKFVTTGTIEEKIDAMMADKQKMADQILDSDGQVSLTEMSDEQIMQFVRLDITRSQL
jgi:non-specific serine/threonine protein kinase